MANIIAATTVIVMSVADELLLEWGGRAKDSERHQQWWLLVSPKPIRIGGDKARIYLNANKRRIKAIAIRACHRPF